MYKILFFLLFTSNILAQNLSILDMLDSEDFGDRLNALEIISKDMLIEYIPELEDRALTQEAFQLRLSFLETLNILKADHCHDMIVQFYNDIDNVTFEVDYDTYSKQEIKVLANDLLIKYSDYTKIADIFSYIHQSMDVNNSLFVMLMSDIYKNVPAYQSQVIETLLRVFNKSTNIYIERITALRALNEINYSEIMPVCVTAINSDAEDPDIKIRCFALLRDKNYSGLRNLIFQNLPVQNVNTLRYFMCNSLLINFGEPQDLHYVVQYSVNEPDQGYKNLILSSIEEFIPPRPTVTTEQMIKNLITYNAQLYQYGWIQDYNTCQQYAALLDKIENEYMTVSQNDLCDDLKILLAQTDSNLSAHLITTEAYKFFHYHGIYIKENVETELGTCP